MSGATLWHGRFEGGPDAALMAYTASLPFDRRLWRDDIAGSRAHVSGLARAGLISNGERDAVLAALDQVEHEIGGGSFVFAEADEDIHTAVERRVTELAGPAGAKLHTARSRNDQVATDLRLWCKRELVGVARAIDGAATDQLQRRADRLAAGRAGRMHRRRIAADAEAPRQKCNARRALTATERARIRCRAVGEQLLRIELAVGCGMVLHGREIGEIDAHHAGADRAAPAVAISVGRRDTGVAHRLLRCSEREAVRAVRVIQQLALRGDHALVEALHLGRDACRKPGCVEQRDRRCAGLRPFRSSSPVRDPGRTPPPCPSPWMI